MTTLEQMKHFFLKHRERLVGYNLIDSDTRRCDVHLPEYVCQSIINNPDVKDFFVLNFPFDSNSGLVDVDSLDSFVFDFYFLDYGDKIVIDDARRTFDCGVECYEGNGVILKQLELTEKYLLKNGLQYSNYTITKETSIETFVQDTITFVKVLQTLNNAQPYPPYILELDDACEVTDLLTRCWIYGEKIEADNSSRAVALFDNHKNLQEYFDCKEDAYPPFFNKHKFVGVFFNSEGMLLVRKRTDNGKALYDFAIDDYVLVDECNSLSGLQRAISNDFGFDFFFGDVAPKLTLKQNKLISDYYVIHCYDISIEQLKHNDNYSFEWINKDTLLSLLNNGSFLYCSMNIINYSYEI